MSWYHRLVNLTRSRRLVGDIEREMAFHVSELIDELVSQGMSQADARREAYRRFGHRGVLQERVRHVDVLAWLESMIGDVQYALRALRQNPGFSLVAVLSLALGIGANTAIFSLVNAVMLRSAPVLHPEELVQVEMGDGNTILTNPIWEEIRERQTALAGVTGFSDRQFNLTTGGVVRPVDGAWVSGEYFNVLGIPAVAGRVLSVADDQRGCRGAAVLSHSFWQREYGGDVSAVGRAISLDGHPFEIIGVSAAGFSGIHVGRPAHVFTPLCTVDIVREGRGVLDARSTWFVNVFGRLRPNGTLVEVHSDLAAVAPAVYEATVPTHWATDEQRDYMAETLVPVPAANGLSAVRGQYSEALFVLLVVVSVVLLIACANVAQLLLARSTARQREISVRLALGSGRARVVRQLFTESVLLALLGAAAGTVFARWSSGLVVAFLSQSGRPVSLDLSLDIRVLAFTIAVATVTGLLFALAPAWRSASVDPQMALRGAGRGLVGESSQQFVRGIVVGQIALSLVLVIAAGLLVGSFQRMASIDPGFRSDGVLVVNVDWSNVALDEDRQRSFSRELLDRVRAEPGVRHGSASLVLPISGSGWNEYVQVDGFTPESQRDALVWFNGVTDGFLETLGTDLLSGRDLTPWDRTGAPAVVLVNQTLARRFFGDSNPIGQQIRTNDHDELGPLMEIVGVVEDAKYRRVDEEPLATAYVPLEQTGIWRPSIALALRTDGAPAALVPVVTDAISQIHPSIALEFTTLDEQLATSLARPRLLATLSGFFGVLALLLAVIGLYGTISYSVARRRNEIGIRIALGAARLGMLRMVAGEAGNVVALGVALGALLALATNRLVASFLYGVTATDPATMTLSALILAAVAMAAGMVPAWRAAGVDPMVTLRED